MLGIDLRREALSSIGNTNTRHLDLQDPIGGGRLGYNIVFLEEPSCIHAQFSRLGSNTFDEQGVVQCRFRQVIGSPFHSILGKGAR